MDELTQVLISTQLVILDHLMSTNSRLLALLESHPGYYSTELNLNEAGQLDYPSYEDGEDDGETIVIVDEVSYEPVDEYDQEMLDGIIADPL